jgi:Major Facilitator Superfamily
LRVLGRLDGFAADQRPDIKIFLSASAIDALGTGLYLTIYATFAIRVVGLSAWHAGVILSAAGFAGVVGAVPLVSLLDRIGPRRLQVYIYLLRAAGYAAIAFSHSAWLFIAALIPVGVLDRASGPVMQALVGGVFAGADRTRALSMLRAWRNVGFVAGALVGTAVFLARSTVPFTICILVNSASFGLAAGGFARLKPGWNAAGRGPRPRRHRTLPDGRYLRTAALHGLLSLHGSLLTFALPLWIGEHTRTPRWIIPLLIGFNCCLAIAIQGRASSGSEELAVARRVSARAGAALAVCCLALAAAGWLPEALALCCLVPAVGLMTFAEVWQAAGAATLSLDLAPSGSRGAHLSVFGFFLNCQGVLGPVILAGCVGAGAIGLAVLAAVFGGAAALVARVPLGTRTPAAVPERAGV